MAYAAGYTGLYCLYTGPYTGPYISVAYTFTVAPGQHFCIDLGINRVGNRPSLFSIKYVPGMHDLWLVQE